MQATVVSLQSAKNSPMATTNYKETDKRLVVKMSEKLKIVQIALQQLIGAYLAQLSIYEAFLEILATPVKEPTN